uniref:Glycine-rich domain-containing protein n=1 Tax=Mycobacterium phage BabyBack TaxID=3158877 RepID=A0AAU8GUB1_9CAUD
MPVRIGDATPSSLRFGDLTATKAYLGDVLVFPAFSVVSQAFTTVGNWAFNIPLECAFIDVVLLGGGGGGSSGNIAASPGEGGYAGQWQYFTLRRGIDIPWNVLQITGTVGGGGDRGAAGWVPDNGENGGNTTATVAGVATWTALGGEGGNPIRWTTEGRAGRSPGTITLNDIPYVGGAATPSSATNGNAPGGGGGGGNAGAAFLPAGAGGLGARGQAWCRAYV